jgi:acetyl esterase/lipase
MVCRIPHRCNQLAFDTSSILVRLVKLDMAKMPSEISNQAPTDVPEPTSTLIYRTIPAGPSAPVLDLDLDLYLPPVSSTTDRAHPLVIWFHGGGLLQGNKENLPPHFRRLPRTSLASPAGQHESVAVISPNYRLAPQVPILDILSDVTALLDFVREQLNGVLANNGEARIDTTRICLSGGSAGGYLALMAGLSMPERLGLEEVGGYRGETGIRCIAPFYPITDLHDAFWATKTDPVPWMDRRCTIPGAG